jgi:Zn-dependent protease with chaperone function
MSNSVRKSKKNLLTISSRDWEHPADRAALDILRSIPGLDSILQTLMGGTTERSLRQVTLASAVRVTPLQFGRIYRMVEESCTILNAKEMPETFVSQNPFLNAGAVGVSKPFIVLNSALVQQCSDEELLAVVAHEVGHILSGHVLYKTLLSMLLKFTFSAFSIPLGQTAIIALVGALREWDRKSELTADRAGLLVVQEPMISYSVLMKLAGGPFLQEMDIHEFFKQAHEYEQGETLKDSFLKLFNEFDATHPFPVTRLIQLKMWVDSGEYQRLLDGTFEQQSSSTFDSFAKATSSYKNDFSMSKDQLTTIVSSVLSNIEDTATKTKNTVQDWFTNSK